MYSLDKVYFVCQMSSIRFNAFYGILFHQHNIIIYNNYIEITTICYNNNYRSGCVLHDHYGFSFST